MRYPLYLKARQALLTHVSPNDSGYCTVLATAQATDCSMSKAYHTCKAHGRRDRDGMNIKGHIEAIKSLGFEVEEIDHCLLRRTVLTVNQAIKTLMDSKSSYVVYIRGHVICYREGEVRDWHQITHAGKAIRKHVECIYKVTKK